MHRKIRQTPIQRHLTIHLIPQQQIRDLGILVQDRTLGVKTPECDFLERGYVFAVVCGARVVDGGVEMDDGGGD
jgi:hypothetical protein